MLFRTAIAVTMASAAMAFSSTPANGSSRTALSMGLKVGDAFPKDALKKWGVSGKTSVVYFYGADDAPSCKKENSLFDAKVGDFKKAGAAIVGVRNGAGAKDAVAVSQKLVIDEADAVRSEIGIKKDLFGLLGGRETYVINKKGDVEFVYNDQFKPEDHVKKSLSYVEANMSKKSTASGFDLAAIFAKK
eukprot:scaffold31070_cov46-Attheya_sp.AAC.6